MTSGDEPHYLVMLNSLLRDGDLDLRNNYDSALRGSLEAGAVNRGQALDRHVGYYLEGRYVDWRAIYDASKPWKDDGATIGYARRPGATRIADPRPQYSIHPPGLPLFLAFLLWPFRGLRDIESVALLASGLFTCAAAWYFRKLVTDLGSAAGWANACTALLFLATPAWHYARTLFCEPYLLFFAVFAYQAALRPRGCGPWRALLAGLAIGLGVFMKPPFGLLAPAIAAFLAVRRQWRPLVCFCIPIAAAVGVTLAVDALCFGSPFHPPQPWRTGNPLAALWGLYAWWDKSLTFYCPAIVIPLAAWPLFAGSAGSRVWVLLGGFAPFALLMLLWDGWHGGYCYGPRLFVPILPLVFASAAVYPAVRIRGWARAAVGALVLWSLAVNTLAVVYFVSFWGGCPLLRMLQ